MKTRITILTLSCCLSILAVADDVDKATGSVSGLEITTPVVLPVTNLPPAFVSPATNNPPGSFQSVTNPVPRLNPSSSNDAAGYVPPGYQNPYANYTNPYYNYTNPYWAAHNTNAPVNTNYYANTNWSNTSTNSSNISTNRHRWWKWW
jgi:hypothetical protein